MDRLWGEMVAVPERNIRVLRGGERVIDGAFEVAYTPGHASHHVCYLHGETAFVGDVGGVRIVPDGLTIPPTPPPDVDVEAWHRSIEQIRAWAPRRLAITHFGAYDDMDAQLSEVSERLDRWAGRVREEDRDAFMARVEAEIEAAADPGIHPAYTQAAPPEQVYMGLERYWRKRAEAPPAPASPPVS
jgi:glyoxylase-like metal-dependent hydrolase (beta-lactamase superfamily II)